MSISSTELLLGTIGMASSIYEPWVGDPFAPVFVTLARTAGVMSLFLCTGLGMLALAARGELDLDPTMIAVIAFAVGAAAPIVARGAWSLIDVGNMFNNVMYESYMPDTRRSLPEGVLNHQNNIQSCNVGSIGVRMFVVWTIAVFTNLMNHNVCFHKLAPYVKELFSAIGTNIEKMFYGKAIIDRTSPEDRWDWSKRGWGARLKGLLNIVILDSFAVGFLMLQAFAALGEALLLAVGSLWISVAVAAHVDALVDVRNNRGDKTSKVVSPEEPLRHVVEDLICSSTCNHRIDDRHTIMGTPSIENEKAYLNIMPKVRIASLGGRGTG